jgi:hypothetical protein
MITHRDVGDEHQPRKRYDVSWPTEGASTRRAAATSRNSAVQPRGEVPAIVSPPMPAQHQPANE